MKMVLVMTRRGGNQFVNPVAISRVYPAGPNSSGVCSYVDFSHGQLSQTIESIQDADVLVALINEALQ